MFVGREQEFRFLQECYESDKAELIMIYGRRRIGKTELLKQFSKDKQAVFFSCTECTDKEQLVRFSKSMFKMGIPAAKFLDVFADWEIAFRNITEIPTDKKPILIIDEFPYMCKANPEIPSILQNLWDNELSEHNIMLILSGSAISYIEDKLLGEKNPLYGRATGIYKLKPLSFTESKSFFPGYDIEDQVTAYAILGGVPYYLEQFNQNLSVAENTKRHILRKGCVLYSEVEFLLRQELRETRVYNTIIEAVALGSNTLSLLYSKTQIEKTKITAYLKNLIELGIIEREFSVLNSQKERQGTSKGMYRLTDSFFRFWYSFVYGSYSELETGDVEGVWRYMIEPQLHQFVSHSYEIICIEYLRQRNKEDTLPFHFAKIGRWWDNVNRVVDGKKRTVPEEIDIVATDYANKNFLLAECKFRHEPTDIDVLRHLQQKFPADKYGGEYHYAIFSFYGFTPKLRQVAKKENIMLIEQKEH